MASRYADYFPTFIKKGVDAELLDEKLLQFDLVKLGAALQADRDLQFDYLGLQTLYDRYFLHVSEERIEMPQAFYTRVAMGLSLNEIDREARAIEFYEVLSTFDFMSSTPTLFNSGTHRSQLSSCYLTTVADDLDGIYEAIKANALLSKFAGGLGNDWTNVRAMGSHIKGTNGKSQGVVPFLKVVNDTAVAVNQCLAPDTASKRLTHGCTASCSATGTCRKTACNGACPATRSATIICNSSAITWPNAASTIGKTRAARRTRKCTGQLTKLRAAAWCAMP